MEVVLFEPQIPQNTGNIVRTCNVTGARLTLVEPLGFRPTDRHLKRAGLDYWLGVEVNFVANLEDYLQSQSSGFHLFSSKAVRCYSEVSYQTTDLLVFGAETHGLPPALLERYKDRAVRIPMREGARCLNLSNSVAIALYEAWRQLNFSTL